MSIKTSFIITKMRRFKGNIKRVHIKKEFIKLLIILYLISDHTDSCKYMMF